VTKKYGLTLNPSPEERDFKPFSYGEGFGMRPFNGRNSLFGKSPFSFTLTSTPLKRSNLFCEHFAEL